MNRFFLVLLFLPSLLFSQWIDVTDKIYGDLDADLFGYATAINATGDIVAASSYLDYSSEAGYVKVLQNINGDWLQVGEKIVTETGSYAYGYEIALNSIGDIIAVSSIYEDNAKGVTRVYQFTGGEWNLLGDPISGSNNSTSGKTISLNASGNILAVGAPSADSPANNMGEIITYQYNGTNWEQLGAILTGETSFDYFGHSVQLNNAGNILVAGAERGNNNDSGFVKAYVFQNDNWQQLGQKISGTEIDAEFGKRVAVNNSGTIIAGMAGANTDQNSIGYARVYELSNNSWILKGSPIIFDDPSEFNSSPGFDLNGPGTVLAIGSSSSDGSVDYGGGQVTVHQFEDDEWSIVGEVIEGDVLASYFGFSLGLNDVGDILVSGAPLPFSDDPDEPAIGQGFVRILYSDEIILNSGQEDLDSVSLFPNPTSGKFQINISPLEVIEISVFDAIGRKIDVIVEENETSFNIDISNLNSGVYQLKMDTSNGTYLKSIIKK